ncbi:NTE family protein [Arboricoccus pini]|uniref:NTE family protein n=1 Tax=Arboricoccus pini TaxID=1963835 RepID=A0A212QRV1_9PROT|nr:patatin-like phospholipase family protein [Arboricoccus pini]SNB62305.1 NTE family protein [Arboricoccus pini]
MSVRLTPLSLALQGGGAHGAFTWGVLDRLLEEDVTIRAISGTSAGALNAVALASGLLADGRAGARSSLDLLWRTISGLTPLQLSAGPFGRFGLGLATHLFSPYQLNPIGLDPLGDALAQIIDFAGLRAADLPRLLIAATNAKSGALKIFENSELSAAAVMASACLPQLFRAVEIDGESYWDGGFTSNPPIVALARAMPAHPILLVRIEPIEIQDVPRRADAIRARVAQLAFAQPLVRELLELERLQTLLPPSLGLLSRELRELRRNRITTINAGDSIRRLDPATRFVPDWSLVCNLRDAGRAAAEAWLAGEARHLVTAW